MGGSGRLERRLAGGAAWSLAGRALSVPLVVVSNALVARLLSPADAGTYFLSYSVVIGAAVVAQVGLHRVVVRFIAESLATGDSGRTRAVGRIVFRSSTVTIAVVAGAFVLPPVARVLSALFESTDLGRVAWLLALLIAARAMVTLRAEFFRGFQEISYATLFGGIDAMVVASIALAFVWLFARDRATLELVLAITVVGWLPGLLVSSAMLRRRMRVLTGTGAATYGEILASAWPLLAVTIGSLITGQAALWIVGAQLPSSDVARFGAALRLVNMVSVPMFVLGAVVPPMIAELHATGRREELGRTLRLAATASALPAAGVLAVLVFGAGQVLGIVFGEFYRAGGIVLTILGVGHLVNIWLGPTQFALAMTGHERALMYITLGSGVLLVVGGVLVVEPYGSTGVAFVAATAAALQGVASWFAVRALVGVSAHAGIGAALEAVRFVRRGLAEARRARA